MDSVGRVIAIIIEGVILTGLAYAVLNAVRLTAFDLGIGLKYSKFVTLVLLGLGFIALIFFIAHLTAFYPS